MIPTLFGLLTAVLGFWLLRQKNVLLLLAAMLALGLLEASAAIFLPSLGNSSIPPARMMLGFLLLASLWQLGTRASLLQEALAANWALAVFCIYGLISALLLPKIFAGAINVVPMRPVGLRSLFDTFPLAFSPQNVTTGVYLIGTGLTAITAYIAGRLATDITPLIKVGIAIALTQAITGILGVLLVHTPWDAFVDFIRNGSYSQIQQADKSLIRVSGFMSEPSAYARVAIIWMVFCTELWLRDIRPRWSGVGALLLAGVLIASASSTAYVGLGIYAIVLAGRFLTFPTYARSAKLLPLALFGVLGVIGLLALIVLSDTVANEFAKTFQRMTVEKSGSESGQQRLFWAMQGIDAFKVSWGLGIGAGSFRSSSIAMAIVGSMGVIGICSFTLSCLGLFRFSPSPRAAVGDKLRLDVASAAAWSALGTLYPAIVIQNSPDPGMEFAAFAGLALALRLPALAPASTKSNPTWGRSSASGERLRPPPTPQGVGWRRFAK